MDADVQARLVPIKALTDIAIAWIGVISVLVGGVFGSIQYLEKKRDDRIKETMEFLDRYNSGVIFDARRKISEVWRNKSEEQNLMLANGVSPEAFNQFALRVIREEELDLSIVKLHGFYEMLDACISNEICERDVAINMFKRNAHRTYAQHYAYIVDERKRRQDPSFGVALERIAKAVQ